MKMRDEETAAKHRASMTPHPYRWTGRSRDTCAYTQGGEVWCALGEDDPIHRVGIVPGRLDPYTYADHLTALTTAKIAHGAIGESSAYTIKHAALRRLQLIAQRAQRELWQAIGDHPVHCQGCNEEETP